MVAHTLLTAGSDEEFFCYHRNNNNLSDFSFGRA